MEAPRRVADALFRRDMVGPTFGHLATSVTGLLLFEKVFLDFVLPPWVPMIEVVFAALGRLWAGVLLSLGTATLGYWVFGTLFTLPALLGARSWKIQEKRRLDLQQLWQAMPFIVFNFTLGSLLAPVLFSIFLPDSAFDFRALPTARVLVWQVVVWMAAEEIMFFYLHRWMHTNKRMYQAVHKIHHTWTSPVAFTAIYCHPVEHVVVNIWPLVAGPLLCGSHVAAIGVYLALALIHTTAAHSGYWLCDDNGMHDEHHRSFNVNYGVVGIMDSLYGTYQLPEGAAGSQSPPAPKRSD